jgi:hypothetical protein
MFPKSHLGLLLLVSTPTFSQMVANSQDSQMQVPPPVSSEAFSTTVGAEARSNYLHAGIGITTAYNDNVLLGTQATPDSDMSYSFWPTISLDRTTPRVHQTFTYSPGFTVYQHTASRNQADQNLSAEFQYRLSPYITINLQDSFRKSSNVFNQSYSSGSVSGSTQTSLTPVVAPIADQINNAASAELTYQYAENSMIGGSAIFSNLNYPHPNEVSGLADSASRGVAGFYSYRLSKIQYLGSTYHYSQTSGTLTGSQATAQENANSELRNHSILAFYTIYPNQGLSLSISGGPQHYDVSQSLYPKISAWAPLIGASIGWQGSRTSFALSYSHIVGGGGGLVGAFSSNSANVSTGWQIARTWTIGADGSYAITRNVSPFLAEANPGGHILSESIAAQHPVNNRFAIAFGYQHIHQSYANIAIVTSAPEVNREYVSLSYQLTRPLGR